VAHLQVPAPPSGTVPEHRVTVHWHVSDEQFVAIAVAHGKSQDDVKEFLHDDGTPRFRTVELEVDGQKVSLFGAASEVPTGAML
jgi:hypothetical protein